MSRPINDAKNKLLNCGKELLLQNGYFDLSITKLTHICHMGTGTFYHYFSSKADLVVDIVQADWDSALNSIDNAISDKTLLDVKLRKIYEILKLFNDTYDAIWVQFGAERGNIERFTLIKETYVKQVAKRIENIINEFLAENEAIIIPITVDKLALIILENMLIIIKTPKFDFDFFIETLWKWAFITRDIHKG